MKHKMIAFVVVVLGLFGLHATADRLDPVHGAAQDPSPRDWGGGNIKF